MFRTFIKLLMIATVAMTPAIAAAEITSIEDAINKAGRQRMLSQQMLRDYALLGVKEPYTKPELSLSKAVALFDAQLAELKAYPVNAKVTGSLSLVDDLWGNVKGVLRKPPVKGEVLSLREGIEELLSASDETTRLLSASSKKRSAQLVNISGRQRMLSQRMANLYMLRGWGVAGTDYDGEFKKVVAEFTDAHQKLSKAAKDSPAVTKALEKVGRSLFWFGHVADSDKEKFLPYLIASRSNKILAQMDKITEMFETIK